MADELKKYQQVKEVIQEWVDKQGHDRCWYYPELFMKLAELCEITPTTLPSLPPREEFERGCKRYQEKEFSK